jgi:RimJ/RimL family protein N-acetyltransferase
VTGAVAPAIPTLHTERLVLRAWTAADVGAWDAVGAHPEVAPWIGVTGGLDPAAAWRSVAFHLGHWALRGYGQWVVERAADAVFLGRAGLYQPQGWVGLEVGWVIDPAHWSNGYATEAGRAALAWGFDTLDDDEVVSLTRVDNHRSRRVMAKLGLELRRELEHAGQPHVLYGITRQRWRQLQGAET